MKTLKDFQVAIQKATTKDELREITYKAFLSDDNSLRGARSLYNKVVTAAVNREVELGL